MEPSNKMKVKVFQVKSYMNYNITYLIDDTVKELILYFIQMITYLSYYNHSFNAHLKLYLLRHIYIYVRNLKAYNINKYLVKET